jgi:hypothetical protein
MHFLEVPIFYKNNLDVKVFRNIKIIGYYIPMFGKIYIITPITTDCDIGDIYIGSTTRDLKVRFREHNYKYNLYKNKKYNFVSSFTLFDKYGFENCTIQEIDNIEFNDKLQLREREAYHIRNNLCVNDRCSILDIEREKKTTKERTKRWLEFKVECECGRVCSLLNMNKHLQSKIHHQLLCCQ